MHLRGVGDYAILLQCPNSLSAPIRFKAEEKYIQSRDIRSFCPEFRVRRDRALCDFQAHPGFKLPISHDRR